MTMVDSATGCPVQAYTKSIQRFGVTSFGSKDLQNKKTPHFSEQSMSRKVCIIKNLSAESTRALTQALSQQVSTLYNHQCPQIQCFQSAEDFKHGNMPRGYLRHGGATDKLCENCDGLSC